MRAPARSIRPGEYIEEGDSLVHMECVTAGRIEYNAFAVKPVRVVKGAKTAKATRPRRHNVPLRIAHAAPVTPERMLRRAAKWFLQDVPRRCTKCDSTFIHHEPAFVHCHYCGKIARIAGRSMLVQEEFEMRSGLRVAS
jgi:hypothetical protein